MSGNGFNRRRIAAAMPLLLAFAVAGLRAQVTEPASAAQRLKSVGVYAFGGVGFAGRISHGEIDYRAILAEPSDLALRQFEDVFAHGNNQAKSYALAGIYKLDPARFKTLYEGVASSDDVVMTMSGCIISRRKLKDVARGISGAKTSE